MKKFKVFIVLLILFGIFMTLVKLFPVQAFIVLCGLAVVSMLYGFWMLAEMIVDE